MNARVDAVCVVHADVPMGRKGVVDSAIDKRPVDGPVAVHSEGIAGDYSRDTKFHGGGDQAVYAYDSAEAERWASDLGRQLPPGWFGENLRTTGLPVTDAVVGTRWRIDDVVLEVTIARRPCSTFARWSGEAHWVKRFTARGDVGAYLRVVTPGTLRAGATVRVEDVPSHGVTVRDLFDGTNPDGLAQLLRQRNLPVKVERDATVALRKHTES